MSVRVIASAGENLVLCEYKGQEFVLPAFERNGHVCPAVVSPKAEAIWEQEEQDAVSYEAYAEQEAFLGWACLEIEYLREAYHGWLLVGTSSESGAKRRALEEDIAWALLRA